VNRVSRCRPVDVARCNTTTHSRHSAADAVISPARVLPPLNVDRGQRDSSRTGCRGPATAAPARVAAACPRATLRAPSPPHRRPREAAAGRADFPDQSRPLPPGGRDSTIRGLRSNPFLELAHLVAKKDHVGPSPPAPVPKGKDGRLASPRACAASGATRSVMPSACSAEHRKNGAPTRQSEAAQRGTWPAPRCR